MDGIHPRRIKISYILLDSIMELHSLSFFISVVFILTPRLIPISISDLFFPEYRVDLYTAALKCPLLRRNSRWNRTKAVPAIRTTKEGWSTLVMRWVHVVHEWLSCVSPCNFNCSQLFFGKLPIPVGRICKWGPQDNEQPRVLHLVQTLANGEHCRWFCSALFWLLDSFYAASKLPECRIGCSWPNICRAIGLRCWHAVRILESAIDNDRDVSLVGPLTSFTKFEILGKKSCRTFREPKTLQLMPGVNLPFFSWIF